MKLKDPRPGRNGKLAQRKGSLRRRLKDGILHPKANPVTDLWRRALAKRRGMELDAMWAIHPDTETIAEMRGRQVSISYRLEEAGAIELFAKVPTIFAIMEDLDPDYRRPTWADHRYGNR